MPPGAVQIFADVNGHTLFSKAVRSSRRLAGPEPNTIYTVLDQRKTFGHASGAAIQTDPRGKTKVLLQDQGALLAAHVQLWQTEVFSGALISHCDERHDCL